MSTHAANSALASKYDPNHERDVIDWVQNLLSIELKPGMTEMKNQLLNGQILVKLVKRIFEGTPQLPAKAANFKFKLNESDAPFKKMENINNFLKAIEFYGVPKTGLFQTVDLYEGRNMTQVLNSILQLGSEAQRHGFNGMTIGPKPTEKNFREFSDAQLKAGQGIIGLQAGTNKCASQKGMGMGATRHISDIKVDDMSKEGQGVIGLQAGSNKGASQSGMSLGATRHISDIKVDSMSAEGQGVIGLQAGSNKGASQSGMSIGATRHISDIKVDSMSAEGQGVIGLQAGSNKGASQSGMSIGATRHISDIKVDGASREGQGVIGLQMGTNQGANQSGMNIGNTRHIVD
ncbi:muscle-specific protein 20-like isoform X2 [Tubulanus polymorphus]|uniref:muscle-specific protein 20-like isoform X2 n=1 Tax=Tubulanus polymorphus TaxID=672921 RepID=UPI003DA63931